MSWYGQVSILIWGVLHRNLKSFRAYSSLEKYTKRIKIKMHGSKPHPHTQINTYIYKRILQTKHTKGEALQIKLWGFDETSQRDLSALLSVTVAKQVRLKTTLLVSSCSTHSLTRLSHQMAGMGSPDWSGWTHQTLPSIPSRSLPKVHARTCTWVGCMHTPTGAHTYEYSLWTDFE